MSDYQEVYDYFKHYKTIHEAITRLEERLETIKSKYELQAQKYSAEPSGKGGKPASYDTMLMQTERLYKQLEKLYYEADTIKATFDKQSILVDDQLAMRVIEMYFFDGMSHQEVAINLHLAPSRVSQLKRKGLECINLN